MISTEDKKAPGTDGIQEFTMQYGGRELPCRVEKEGDKLRVSVDNTLFAEFEAHRDGSITQVSGNTLPDSNVEFIKKQVLGFDK